MDTQKQTAMRNHMRHTYQMWLTGETQTFSPSLHTVTLHVIVFNLMGGYQAFKAAHCLHLHSKVTTKHYTTHCQNADATVKSCATGNTTMLHTYLTTSLNYRYHICQKVQCSSSCRVYMNSSAMISLMSVPSPHVSTYTGGTVSRKSMLFCKTKHCSVRAVLSLYTIKIHKYYDHL
jgi:hypothetical protein